MPEKPEFQKYFTRPVKEVPLARITSSVRKSNSKRKTSAHRLEDVGREITAVQQMGKVNEEAKEAEASSSIASEGFSTCCSCVYCQQCDKTVCPKHELQISRELCHPVFEHSWRLEQLRNEEQLEQVRSDTGLHINDAAQSFEEQSSLIEEEMEYQVERNEMLESLRKQRFVERLHAETAAGSKSHEGRPKADAKCSLTPEERSARLEAQLKEEAETDGETARLLQLWWSREQGGETVEATSAQPKASESDNVCKNVNVQALQRPRSPTSDLLFSPASNARFLPPLLGPTPYDINARAGLHNTRTDVGGTMSMNAVMEDIASGKLVYNKVQRRWFRY
ncbi:MAG: hypothetical protein M1827_003390 [Pycnora praestabilis]|nr:MAG: hypothetical protein M1827_003390 [Pycnora praestabilis]